MKRKITFYPKEIKHFQIEQLISMKNNHSFKNSQRMLKFSMKVKIKMLSNKFN